MRSKKYILLFAGATLIMGGVFLFSQRNLFVPKKITIESSPIEETTEKQEDKKTEEINQTSETLPKNEAVEEQPKQELPQEETQTQQAEEERETIETDSADFIKQKLVSWGYLKSSSRKIDTIVIHSSYDALGDKPYDLDGLLDEYKQYGVAAHYLIDRKGNLYRLVEDKNIAYHAGISSVPDGRTNVNFFSIGIELMNTKEDEYTSKQYTSLKELLAHLQNNYSIKYTLGHDDIAPGRKTDPWNFDWDEIK